MFYRLIEDDSAENVLNLSGNAYDYENIAWPNHLATAEVVATDNTPVDNPLTDEGALLGRVLFCDKNYQQTIPSPVRLAASKRMASATQMSSVSGLKVPNCAPIGSGLLLALLFSFRWLNLLSFLCGTFALLSVAWLFRTWVPAFRL
ncbi:MAG: hypothetical protein ACN4GF_01360 [Lentimonas sp.]